MTIKSKLIIFSIEISPLETPLQAFPEFPDLPKGAFLRSFENQTYLLLKALYQPEKDDASIGLKAGETVGHFVMAKKLPLDHLKSGEHLGVSINFYDPLGKMIQGEFPFLDLDLSQVQFHETRITLEDLKGNRYDSLLNPIVVNGQTVGYLSVNIDQAIKPIAHAVTILSQIAEVGGDLTQRMDECGNDELSKLAHAFNQFIGKVNHIIQRVQKSTEILASSAVELASSTAEMTKTANDVR